MLLEEFGVVVKEVNVSRQVLPMGLRGQNVETFFRVGCGVISVNLRTCERG